MSTQVGIIGTTVLIGIKNALNIGSLVVHAELVIAVSHDDQSFFGLRRSLEVQKNVFSAIDGGNVGVANVIILGGIDFVLGLSLDQLMHTFAGIAGVAAVRETKHQFFENIESIARSLSVALRKVLTGQIAHPAFIFVQGGNALNVEGVRGQRMLRILP